MLMGIGNVGQPTAIIKRKFRFILEINTPCGNVPRHYVKSAARPRLTIDNIEVNFLNATTWLPGRAKWEPITVRWVDVATTEMQGLFNWIATLYNFNNTTGLQQSEKAGWAATAILTILDGCGNPLEVWTLGSVWPESIDFGEVSYGESDELTIEMALRYSEVYLQGICSPTPQACACVGC